jgi:hypothetical protein
VTTGGQLVIVRLSRFTPQSSPKLGSSVTGSSVRQFGDSHRTAATEPTRGTATPSVSTLAASCYPGPRDALKARRTGRRRRKKQHKRSQFTLYFQHRWGNQSPWARCRDPRDASNRADRSAFRAVSGRRAGFDSPRSSGTRNHAKEENVMGETGRNAPNEPNYPQCFQQSGLGDSHRTHQLGILN